MFEYFLTIDRYFENLIITIHSNSLEILLGYLTNFGGALIIIPLFLLILVYLWRNDRSLLRPFVVGFASNELVVYLLKFLVARPRPLGALKYLEFSGSMPSGHATASIFIYGFIIFLIVKKFPKSFYRCLSVFIIALLVITIGFSRLYMDVHFLSDVLVGYLIGGIFLFVTIKVSKNLVA